MQMRYSVLSGMASSAVSALSAIAIVPVYLHYLGQEAYGVVGFYLTLQAVLGILDFGFSTSVNREIAQTRAPDAMLDVSRMVSSLIRLYWATAIAIMVLIASLAPWLAERWLNLHSLPIDQAGVAIALAAVSLGVRWPSVIYRAVLLGSGRMVACSWITIAMTLLTSLGNAILVIFWHADLRGVFAWQGATGLLFVLWLHVEAKRSLPKSAHYGFDIKQIRRTWRLSTSLGVIGLIGLIFMQMDKLILSRMLPLQAYAQYMLATLLASGLYTLVSPVFDAIYPRLSALVSRQALRDLASIYRLVSGLLASLLFPLTMFLVFTGRSLVQLWTGNLQLAEAVWPVAALLAVGSALHGMMFMPYALALAFGASALVLRTNVILLFAFGPLIAAMTASFGAVGAAFAWAILHGAYLSFGSIYIHRILLPQITTAWLLRDLGVPGVVSLFTAMTGLVLTRSVVNSPLHNVVIGVAMMLLAWAILVARQPQLRQWLRHKIPK